MKKFLFLIFILFIFGCPENLPVEDDDDEVLLYEEFSAYKYSEEKFLVYTESGECLFFNDEKIVYFNDNENSHVLVYLENGFPVKTIWGDGIIIYEVFGREFDFVAFDREDNLGFLRGFEIKNVDSINNALDFETSDYSLFAGILILDSFVSRVLEDSNIPYSFEFCDGDIFSLSNIIFEDFEIIQNFFDQCETISDEDALSLTSEAQVFIAELNFYSSQMEDEVFLANGILETDGGRGSIKFTATWNSLADLDISVYTPNGLIYYGNKEFDGGILSIDDPDGFGPENIYWEEKNAPSGNYRFCINHYYGLSPTRYNAMIQFEEEVFGFSGEIIEGETVELKNLMM